MAFGEQIGSLFFDIDANTDGLQKGLGKAKSSVEGLSSKFSDVAGFVAGGFGFGLATTALDAVSSGFGAVATSVIGTNAAMQDSKTSWGVLLGGAEQAQSKLDELFKFGATTPFEFGEVDRAAKLLQTFGGEALNNVQTLTMVGDAASAANQPFEQVAFWTGRMYDAIQSGKPFGEAAAELQNMGLMSGQTRSMLEQMQKEGAKGPEVWAKYAESQGRFSGMMAEQSNNFNGRMSTMKDTLNQLLATAGRPIFDGLSGGLGKFNDLLANPAVTQFATNLANTVAGGLTSFFTSASKLYTLFQSALLPTFLSLGQTISSGVGSATPIISRLHALWEQLMTALRPAVPLVTTIAGVIGGLLVSHIRNAFDMIGGLGGAFKIVSGTINMFGGVLKVLSSLVVGVVGVVSNVLEGDWAGAWTAAKDMFFGVVDGITQYFSGFRDVFGTLLGNMVSMVLDRAKAIGSAIVNGIANAIRNGFSIVAEAAKGLASSAFNAAKDFLGIHSPSRAFMEVGKYAVAGFGVGFEQNQRLATGSVEAAMSATTTTATNLAGSVGVASNASAAPIHITVHGSVLAERDLENLVASAYNKMWRQGRISFG